MLAPRRQSNTIPARLLDVSAGRVDAVLIRELPIKHYDLLALRMRMGRKNRAWLITNNTGGPSIFVAVTCKQTPLDTGHRTGLPG